jgi:hypothetical protein
LPTVIASLVLALVPIVVTPSPAAAATTILPYRGTGYRYLEVPSGQEPSDWQSLFFDHSSWGTGDAAFGSGGSCPLQPTVNTHWDVNTDMLLRKPITLPAGARGITVSVAVDNDISVYWNGTPVGSANHDGCPASDDRVFSVPDNLLVAGTNLLAVRGSDNGFESFLDVSVSAEIEPSADQPLTSLGAFAPSTGVVGSSVSVGWDFSDADPGAVASDFTAAVDWGDGTTSSGGVTPTCAGQQCFFLVGGSHSYGKLGTFVATAHVRDLVGRNDGGGSTVDIPATVQVRDTVGAKTMFPPKRPRSRQPRPAGPCHTPHPYSRHYDKWSVRLGVTPNSGVTATAVKLGSRSMADDMSNPSLSLFTKRHPNGIGLRLSPCGAGRLVGGLRVMQRATKPPLREFAQTYRLTVDPGNRHSSHLDVTQRFIFEKEIVEGLDPGLQDCEPSEQAIVHNPARHPCARWRLVLSYVFHAAAGDAFHSLNASERLHFRPDGKTVRGAMMAHDCEPFELFDLLQEPCVNGPGGIGRVPWLPGISIFNGDNPIKWESELNAFRSACCGVRRMIPGAEDNLHLTTNGSVGLPVPIPPGCLECVHIHWRWGASIGGSAFGNGNPLIGCSRNPVPCAAQSGQDTQVALLRHDDHRDPSQTVIPGLGKNRAVSGASKSYSGTSPLSDPVVWFITSADRSQGDLFAWGGFFCAPLSVRGSSYGC